MYLFPSIDLRDGRVVRLAQGDYARQTTYKADAVDQARHMADNGATWLHLIDLDGARSGRMAHVRQIEQICGLRRLKVQVGGGVRSEGTIDRMLGAGVERVIVGTAALEKWSWFESMMANPTYRGRLVLGLDARAGKLAVSGWESQLEASAEQIAARVSEWPVAAIVYTDIATDGMMQGPNLAAVRQMTQCTDVPIIASGGVGSLEDLQALRKLKLHGVIVGRAIYEGAFTVAQAIEALEK